MIAIPTDTPASLRQLKRKANLAIFFINLLGGILTFLYFGLIDPLPSGQASLRRPQLADALPFLLVAAVTFSVGFAWGNRIDRRITIWYEALKSGLPASEVPHRVRQDVLNNAVYTAGTSALLWLVAAVFFTWLTQSYRTFIGLAIGGVFSTALLYLVIDLNWRPLTPFFFPDGGVGAIRAIRLPVLGRLLLVFLLVGFLPPVILMSLSWERAQALIVASNPQAILYNLFYLQIFILVVSLVASIGLAVFVTRSITAPLKRLQTAMARVAQNDFDIRVPVTTNDELGYLAERFNGMVQGLKQGEKLRRLFGLYVSPEVARRAVESGAGLDGELVTCTIMFSDLRGFTRLAEQMPPQQLVDLVNRYMTLMIKVILANGGIVTRFGGDSILALFGSPLNPSGSHAAQAANAALEMRARLEEFNYEQKLAGQPALTMGIGIATGPVVAGNVGGTERMEYTVMGDPANLASRLQDLTKELQIDILISEPTYQNALQHGKVHARAIHGASVRGKQERTTLYALV